jgi:hypothetical protein
MALEFWFRGFARGCTGVWGFLTARVCARTAVELERERNAGTRSVLRLLPPGGELVEYERSGRLRVIRMPDHPVIPPATVRDVKPEPPGELLDEP